MLQRDRVIPRLVAGVAALLLMSIASLLLSTGRISDFKSFPPKRTDGTTKLASAISKEVGNVHIHIDVGKKVKRQVERRVGQQVEQRVEQYVEQYVYITSEWSLPARTGLVKEVRSGGFRDHPQLLVLAGIEVQPDTASSHVEEPEYRPPTVDLIGGQPQSAKISLRGRTKSRPAGSVRLKVVPNCQGQPRCTLRVSVHSPDRVITSIQPPEPETVKTQTSSDASVALVYHADASPVRHSATLPTRTEPPTGLEIQLDSASHSDTEAQVVGVDREAQVVDIPAGMRAWASTTWLLLWALVPWAFLARRLSAAVDPPDLPDPRWRLRTYVPTQRLLLSAALIGIAAVMADYLDDAFKGLLSSIELWQSTNFRPVPAASISLVPAAFAIWALLARQEQQGRFKVGILVLQASALAAGVVCFTVAVVNNSLCGPRQQPQELGAAERAISAIFELPPPCISSSEMAQHALVAGLVAGLVGSLLLALTLDPSRRAMGAGMSGCALLVIVALMTASNSTWTALTAGFVAILTGTAMVATLAWTTAGGTGHPAVQRWQTNLTVRAGVLVAAAFLIVIPKKASPGWPSSLARDVLIPLAAATSTTVRLGLLLTTAGVLWALAKRANLRHEPEVIQSLALVTIIALLLRSDVLYGGVPLSFLVGSLLTVTLLVSPASKTADWPLARPKDRGGPEEIKSLLGAWARYRTERDRRAAMRRRVAKCDLDPEDREAIEEAVKTAYKDYRDDPSPPSWEMRANALAWAGTSDAWRRGILGAGAASVVAVFILGPDTFATLIRDITRLSGPQSWDQLLTKLMAFRYPVYGFVFGYFLPLLRGTSGLAKATRLFVVLAASETVILLLPFPGPEQFLEAFTWRVLQLAMLCGVLGVGADLLALRSADGGPSDLFDLYHTNRLILWSSGIAVTIATAVATALVGSATTLLMDRIFPEKHPPSAEAPNVLPEGGSSASGGEPSQEPSQAGASPADTVPEGPTGYSGGR